MCDGFSDITHSMNIIKILAKMKTYYDFSFFINSPLGPLSNRLLQNRDLSVELKNFYKIYNRAYYNI